MSEFKGIDVSKYQGDINWEQVKPDINFAILRCGLGNDIKSQDDAKFERNYTECKRLGIPVTVYFFTYALDKASVANEIAHLKRLLNGKTIDGPVYIDVENTKGLNWRSISDAAMLEIMQEFNTQLNALGYKMGIYSSRAAFWTEKMSDPWYDNVSKWVAEYAAKVNKFDRPYDIWQYSSKGQVAGISGNVDMNIMYNEVIKTTAPVAPAPAPAPKKSNEEIAQEVLQGKWGNGDDRKNRLLAEGYDYNAIQAIVNKLAAPAKPAAPAYTVYTVKRGDTLSGIASRFGTNYRKIAANNGISNPNRIFVGQKLRIYR